MSDENTNPRGQFFTSPTIGKLGKALAAAQGEMKPAVKDSVNPHFKSRFASLAACWEAARVPLSKNELAFTQLPISNGPNEVGVASMLIHGESGEFIASVFTLTSRDATPQAVGSCLTYVKRYAMTAMLAIPSADEDDDGNGAQPTNGYRESNFPPPASKPKVEPKVDETPLIKAIAEAKDIGELNALVPKLRELPDSLRAKLKPIWAARKAHLEEQGQYDPTGDPEPGKAA